MPRSRRRLGETKLKILAIIHYNGTSHGYGIWTILREKFHCYFDEQSRRNVYHHLHALQERGYIETGVHPINENSPQIRSYTLTELGTMQEERFRVYRDILSTGES